MKKIILFLFASIAFFSANAQAHIEGAMGVGDTVITSSSRDTLCLYVGSLLETKNPFARRYDILDLNVRLDSLAGGPAGTLYVEYSNDANPTEAGTTWFRPASGSSSFTYNGATTRSSSVSQFTVNGVTCLLTWHDPEFNSSWVRVFYDTGASSTLSVRARGFASLRKDKGK